MLVQTSWIWRSSSAVAVGVVQEGGQEGGGGVALPVEANQGGQGLGPQKGGVAGQDDDIDVVIVELVVGQPGQAHGGGVPGPPLDPLLHELDGQVGVGQLLEGLGNGLGAVADDHHDPLHRDLGQGVNDVGHHRPPAQLVEGLGPGRAHPGALAGGENDSC